LTVGDPYECDVGPLVDKLQYERVLDFIESGKKESKLLCGGEKLNQKGYYVTPTVFYDVNQ
jgi:acyl-CoA reductase-like NAD-dependent aldehyde dehydrogenase